VGFFYLCVVEMDGHFSDVKRAVKKLSDVFPGDWLSMFLPQREMGFEITFRRPRAHNVASDKELLERVQKVRHALDAYVLATNWNPYDHIRVRLGDGGEVVIKFTDLRSEEVRAADPRVQQYLKHPKYRVCSF
jgi:uncharacterized protein (DUF2461 family)